MKKFFFILIRFSVLVKSAKGWQLANKTYEEYRDELYDPIRLENKVELFKQITLPSLNAQKFAGEKFVYLAVGQDIPFKFKQQLEEIVSNYSWLKIFYVNEEQSNIFFFLENEICKLKQGSIYATIRLDDDDALSQNYLERLSSYLCEDNVGKVVSFSRGAAGFWSEKINNFVELYQYDYPLIALGMAYIDKVGIQNTTTVYNLGSHTKISEKYDVIYDDSEGMFIRTFHESSDSYFVHQKGNTILKIKRNKILGYAAMIEHYPYLKFAYHDYIRLKNGVYSIPFQEGILQFKLEGIEKVKLGGYMLAGFTAAISNRIEKKGPFFSGVGVAKKLDIPLISFADPLVTLNDSLALAWYLGGEHHKGLQYLIASILDYIAWLLKVTPILMGASGGGFSSLVISTFMPSKLNVLALNPQTNVFKYLERDYSKYIRCSFGSEYVDLELEGKKSLLRNNYIKYMLDISENSLEHHTIHYIQNINDLFHVKEHFVEYIRPFINKKNKLDGVFFCLEDFGVGHVPPSPEWICSYIEKNILLASPQKKSSLKKVSLSFDGVRLVLLINNGHGIFIYDNNEDDFFGVDAYLIKNNRIFKKVEVRDCVTVVPDFFDVNDNLLSFKINIFALKGSGHLSKRFDFISN